MGKLVDDGFLRSCRRFGPESMMEAAGFFPTDRNQVSDFDGG